MFPTKPVFGALAHINVEVNQLQWETALGNLPKGQDKARTVYSHWVEDEVLYVRTGELVWDSSRLDRLSGSKVWDLANAPVLANFGGLQLMKVERSTGLDAYPSLSHYQDVALLLSSTLRISAKDVEVALLWLRGLAWHYPDYLPTHESPLLRTVSRFLNTLTDSESWQELGRLFDDWAHRGWDRANILNRMYDGHWPVLFMYYNVPTAARAAAHGRSYFVEFGILPVHAQVHVLDERVARHRPCHLLIFTQQPSEELVLDALKLVSTHFGFSQIPIHTIPDLQIKEPWFRPDGMLQRRIVDTILTPKLIIAFSRRRGSDVPMFSPLMIDTSLSCETQKSIVILARSSQDDFAGPESPARQACSVLADLPEEYTTIGPLDKIWFVLEWCSSSKHPISDRRIFKCIPRSSPIHLLTVSPHRATRRWEEIKVVQDYVASTGGRWLTQNPRRLLHNAIPDDEGLDGEDNFAWKDMGDQEARGIIEDHVKQGRAVSLEMAFYSRIRVALTRAINAKDGFQMDSLRHALTQLCIDRNIGRVLLCARTSPSGDKTRTYTVDNSVARQIEFLRNVLPAHIPTEEFKDVGVSAYHGSYMDRFESRVRESDTNLLILATSLDRLVRSDEVFERLIKAISTTEIEGHRHDVVSFLWDTETRPDIQDALMCPDTIHDAYRNWSDTLQSQCKCTGGSEFLVPIVQPIIWASSDHISPTIEAIAKRHVEKAKSFVIALSLSSRIGRQDLDIPQQLVRDDSGRGFTPSMASTWQNYMSEKLDIPRDQVNVIYLQGNVSWLCHCSTIEDHDPGCVCPCANCRLQKGCSCTKGNCTCAPLCNCGC